MIPKFCAVATAIRDSRNGLNLTLYPLKPVRKRGMAPAPSRPWPRLTRSHARWSIYTSLELSCVLMHHGTPAATLAALLLLLLLSVCMH
jgi:hypothetical protein